MKSILLYLLFFIFLIHSPFAIEFQGDRLQLLDAFKEKRINTKRVRLVILFDSSQIQGKKTHINSIKKNLASEFATSFEVVDPSISFDYVQSKNIPINQLNQHPNVVKNISKTLENNYFLVTTLRNNEFKKIVLSYHLFDHQSNTISQFNSQHFQPFLAPSRIHQVQNNIRLVQNSNIADDAQNTTTELIENIEESDTNIFLDDIFNGNAFANTRGKWDETWNWYSHNAFLINQKNDQGSHLSLFMQAKNFEKVDIVMKHLRADFQYKSFQIGIEHYGYDGASHSGYANIKVNFLDEEDINIPLFLTIGLKRRYFFDDANLDFGADPENNITKKDKELDAISLFFAASYRIDSLGMFLNTYIDNTQIVGSIKYALPYNFHIFVDAVKYRFSSNYKLKNDVITRFSPDFTVGIQNIFSHGLSLNFIMQHRTRINSIGFRKQF